ncbi:hypothetical protein GCM10020221_26820 [Streptomyces thioluteus]|uniref:Uncharacterized protein n=1 Tax=Streptomyces thioluteus TaxID=66431 RepID=A0ABP6JD99_STRTU
MERGPEELPADAAARTNQWDRPADADAVCGVCATALMTYRRADGRATHSPGNLLEAGCSVRGLRRDRADKSLDAVISIWPCQACAALTPAHSTRDYPPNA